MVTVNTSTIGATGRDYATIALWEAATDNDLVTSDTLEVGECYNDATFTEANTIFAGATTDATRYRLLRAASSEGHDGTYSGRGVHWKPTTAFNTCAVRDNYMRIGAGMCIEISSGATNSEECIRVGNGTNPCLGLLIENCILKNSNATPSSADGVHLGNYNAGEAANPVTIQNCTIDGFNLAGIHVRHATGTNSTWLDVINCSIADCKYGIGYDLRTVGVVFTTRLLNNIIGDNSTNDFGKTHASGDTGSIVSTGSANNWDERDEIPGAQADNPMVLLTAEASGLVECIITNKYDDFGLLDDTSANDVLDTGVGPASNSLVPTYDMMSDSRSGATCDPGAFEIATATSLVHHDYLAELVRRRAHSTRLRM